MSGIEVLRVVSDFVALVTQQFQVDVKRCIYDGYAFGNYDIVFSVGRLDININSDRGYFSATVGVGKQKPEDYFRVLARAPFGQKYDPNACPEEQRLSNALMKIGETIVVVEQALKRK